MKKKKTLEIVGDSNGGIAGTKIGKDILHVVASALFNGVPGNILGAQLFDSVSNSGIVELLRGTEEGKIYYAIIRQDDGDRAFDLTKDILMTDTDGIFVSTEFKVTETVSEEE